MSIEPEVVLAPPLRPTQIERVRSTLLLSSRGAIAHAGQEPAYLAAFDRKYRDVLLNAVAGIWLPVEVADAHYRACEALGLSADAQAGMGRSTGDRMKGTVLGTAVKLMRGAGVTPWTLLSHFQRFWDRAFDGGAVSVLKTGPKEARILYSHCSLCDIRYFRGATKGVALGLLSMTCTRAYMSEVSGPRPLRTATFRVQWA